ncbi:MAG TPA: anti-sigma factor [Longimicrobium sp.]|nr:anti-sigma factor [Longimicrobium sp.]
MTPETMHDEMRAALAAEALGALDGEERTLLHAHLAACPACRAELAELRAGAGVLAYASPAAPTDAARSNRVRARLLARAAADRGLDRDDDVSDRTLVGGAPSPYGDDVTQVVPAAPAPTAVPRFRDRDDVTQVTPITAAPSRRRAPVLPWLAAAASLLLLLGAGAYALNLRERVDALSGQVAAAEGERTELERTLDEREAMLAAMSAPTVQVIDMASAEQAEPGGRMFWDRRTDRWTFFAHNMPAVQAGREYQLWLITPGGRKLPAPTFRPGPRGEAQVQATYALPADSLAAVAVTLEPTGGLPAPSGPIVIVGAMAASR